MTYTPTTGDALFCRGGDNYWLSPMIRWFTRAYGEPPSIASHQGIVRDSLRTCEAMPPEVRLYDWAERKREMAEGGHAWTILTPASPLTQSVKNAIIRHIDQSIGWKYSEAELVLCAFDGLLSKIPGVGQPVIFRKAGDWWRDGVICSKTANRPWIKASLLSASFEYATPDDTLDHMITSGIFVTAATSDNWPK